MTSVRGRHAVSMSSSLGYTYHIKRAVHISKNKVKKISPRLNVRNSSIKIGEGERVETRERNQERTSA
jgi:hypothetical protein